MTTAPTTSSRTSALLPVVLTVVAGLLVGVGVTFVALRDDTDDGVAFDSGPPSVASFDPPSPSTGASLTGQEILDRAEQDQQVAVLAAPAVEPTDPAAAFRAFADAEADGRTDESFALLDAATQRRFAAPAAWRQAAGDRPAPTRTTLTDVVRSTPDTVELTVRVERTPEISPFRGLVAAEAIEVWVVRRDVAAGGGWRVADGGATASEPILPPDAGAVEVARRWVEATARCGDAAGAHQLPGPLLGQVALAPLVCERGGDWSTTSAAIRAADLPDVTAFVAAFGPGVGRWGRGVQVASGDERFTVVLGPVGREWRVMGLTSAPPA